jgi:hypothetical protein
MNNIWGAILLAVACVLVSYYLSQYWVPLGWIGFVMALAIVGGYLFNRNKRIQ